MPDVTRNDALQAISVLTNYMTTLETSNAALVAENADLRSQLKPIPAPATTLLGFITDYKVPNDPNMTNTASFHLSWMTDVGCRVVPIWHSIDTLTGDSKWNDDSIKLAKAYLQSNPAIRVVIRVTPDEGHAQFVSLDITPTFNKLLAMIPQEHRSRCYIELVNEPNMLKYWNCVGGMVSAFTIMAPWSARLQAAGFPTISPTVTESYQGNIAGHFSKVPANILSAFTHLGFHCYQNDEVEFRKCLEVAKGISGNRGVAVTEWAQMIFKPWVPPIEVFIPKLPAFITALASNTVLSAYFIATPHSQEKQAQYLLTPTSPITKTPLYDAFKAQYSKYGLQT